MTTLQLAGVIRESIVDGPGIRLVVFSQGCPHHCPGCHNPATHSPEGGYQSSVENIMKAVRSNPMLAGVTLSGGEPFSQAEPMAELAHQVHQCGRNVITYTGYTIEQILEGISRNPGWKRLLEETDTLIDGPFLLEEKTLTLKFRGSRNQRVIDPAASLQEGRAVEKEF